MGENFFIGRGEDSKSRISKEGIVSGEIGGETSEPVDPDAGLLRAIEHDAAQDAELAHAFSEATEGGPSERAGAILDRINEMRRELDASDSDPSFKRDRDRWLSDIANRLRELL